MATYQQESVPRNSAETDPVATERKTDVAESPDQEAIQRAEDNPRATSPPGTSLDYPADADSTGTCAPTALVYPTPQPTRSEPGCLRALLALMLIISIFVGFAVVLTGTFILPGMLTILTGNAICKAANLPYFTHVETAISVGAFGSVFGMLCCSIFVVPVDHLGDCMEKRFKQRNIQSGRIPPYSSREDGHFPVLLIWALHIFVGCLLAGPIGASVDLKTPGFHDLSKANVTVISAIGGIIVAPGCVIVVPLIYGILEPIYMFLWDYALEMEQRGESFMLPYLWRQGEALVWLLRPISPNRLSLSAATSV